MALAPIVQSAATDGDETRLHLDPDGDGTYIDVAELTDLPDLPSFSSEMYETTTMATGDVRQHKKTRRKDGEEVEIVGNYAIASESWTVLKAAEAARGAVAYKIVAKEGAKTLTLEGWALFTNLRRSNPVGEVRQFTITAKWLSEPNEAIA